VTCCNTENGLGELSMSLLEKISHFKGFDHDWRRLMLQGIIILIIGVLLALASVTNSDAIVLAAREFSWLPASGMFIFLLGLIGVMQSFLAKHQHDAIQYLQVGVLDTVIGAMIVISISGPFSRVSLMISAFLLVRGIVRVIFVFTLKLPHKVSTAMGGGLSIILGTLVFQEWPTAESWFVSMCLNIEIAFRGWAGISYALWVKKQKTLVPEKT